MNVEQYKKRFYNLMESTVGNVKPLIKEETGSLDELKITNLDIKDGNIGSSVTLSNGSTYKYSSNINVKPYMVHNRNCKTWNGGEGKFPDGCIVIITLEDGTDHTCDSMGCKVGLPE